jgi:opacity protein-like surface antigen
MKPKLLVICLIIGLFTLTPAIVCAENFADLFVGGAFTEDDDIAFSNSLGVEGKLDENFENSFTFGYRMGHYFEDIPWLGIAAEVSWFRSEIDEEFISSDDTKMDIIPFSALLMLRLPLMQSSEFPYGKYQPYVGAGPSAFISDMDLGDFDDSSIDIGWDLRVGFLTMFAPNFAFFFEYRYTSFEPEFEDIIDGVEYQIEPEFDTHHALVGLSYRF